MSRSQLALPATPATSGESDDRGYLHRIACAPAETATARRSTSAVTHGWSTPSTVTVPRGSADDATPASPVAGASHCRSIAPGSQRSIVHVEARPPLTAGASPLPRRITLFAAMPRPPAAGNSCSRAAASLAAHAQVVTTTAGGAAGYFASDHSARRSSSTSCWLSPTLAGNTAYEKPTRSSTSPPPWAEALYAASSLRERAGTSLRTAVMSQRAAASPASVAIASAVEGSPGISNFALRKRWRGVGSTKNVANIGASIA